MCFSVVSLNHVCSERVPAELGTRFPWLIFIRTAIDFNDLVNRHTLTPLSASSSLSCSPLISIHLFYSWLLCPILFFLLSFSTTKAVILHSHIWQNVITATQATDVNEVCRDSVFILIKSAVQKNKEKTMKK